MLKDRAYKKLEDIVGDEDMLTSREERICYAYDATNLSFMPDAVLFPDTAREISEILRFANSEGFPVIPRGAGSGFTGGSLPIYGGVVVSLEKMNRIIKIDRSNLTAIVEPGVVNADLQREVERYGLFFPPDPSSLNFCTIGGNIAECAGGPRAVKYGVTRDYVLGLEVVLPTGEIIGTGGETLKGVVGYDLTRLIVGSEGTLGIVSKAILKLIPVPESVKTILISFVKIEWAVEAILNIMRSAINPSVLEFIDIMSIEAAGGRKALGIKEDTDALLLVEIDGDEVGIERRVEMAREISQGHGANSIKIASNREETENIWKVRRSISPSLVNLKPCKLNEDVCVPRGNMMGLISGIRSIAKEKGLIIATFGHAGDGNIHVNVMVDDNDQNELKRGKEAVAEIFRLTIGLGGTISGEHGIGITKSRYINMELNRKETELMKRIRHTFDPGGILNPGKIFSDDELRGV